jgi:hypothetical protein
MEALMGRKSKVRMPSFLEGFKHNFELLKTAVRQGHLAMMEMRDRSTGEWVAGIVAIHDEGEEKYAITPLCVMNSFNPYEVFDAPDPKDPKTVLKLDGEPDKEQILAQLHKAESQVHALRIKLGLPIPIFPHEEELPDDRKT